MRYISLPSLIELKIAASRSQDLADVIRLIQANQEMVETIRIHLIGIHADYASSFESLVARAEEEAEH